ncbi:MAG: S-layer protein [Methanomicrobiales archaeon]|nr:S-layer protein [Methanomicrobiales archaeon]
MLPVVIVLIALAICSPTGAVSPTVVVSDFRVSPPVLAPGELGTIEVTLTNTAQSATLTDTETFGGGGRTITTTRTTSINADIQSVFLNGNEVEVLRGSYNDLAVLGPGQSVPVTFLIRAPGVSGIYFPEVWIRVLDGESSNYPIPVNVGTQISVSREPAITVQKTLPDRISPGEQFTVALRLVNQGMSGAENLNAAISTNATSVLVLSPATYHFNRLDPDQAVLLEISFATDRDTPLGILPVMISMDYVAPDGSTKRRAENIGVLVQGKAEMGIASVRTDPVRIMEGNPVDLTIRIENTGTADANSVQATLGGLPLPGAKKAYLGKIEPNNDAPAVFSLQADHAGEFDYTLNVSYSDEYGVHEQRQDLQLIVVKRSAFDLAVPVLLGVIVIAAFLVVWYRRRQGT